jgi:hypothetical protein
MVVHGLRTPTVTLTLEIESLEACEYSAVYQGPFHSDPRMLFPRSRIDYLPLKL